MKSSLLVLSLVLITGWSQTHASYLTPSPTQERSAPVVDAVLVSAHYRQVLQEPLYQEPTEVNAHAQIRDWLSRWFSRIGQDLDHFQYEKELPRFASLLMASLGVLTTLTLLYVLVRLTRHWRGGDLIRTRHPAGYPAVSEFDSSAADLTEALAQRNWRGAWRATWRHFLFVLEQGKLVASDRSRTNREYLAQVHDIPTSAFDRLGKIVAEHDEVIYGERSIAEDDWKSFQQLTEEAAFSLNLAIPRPPLRPSP